MTGLLDCGLGVIADAQPSFDKGPDKPRPHRPLVITAVSLPDISGVMRAIAGLPGCQAARAFRSQQSALDGFHDRPRGVLFEQAERKSADREDLIGPQAGIRGALPMIAIDHIE